MLQKGKRSNMRTEEGSLNLSLMATSDLGGRHPSAGLTFL